MKIAMASDNRGVFSKAVKLGRFLKILDVLCDSEINKLNITIMVWLHETPFPSTPDIGGSI